MEYPDSLPAVEDLKVRGLIIHTDIITWEFSFSML